MPLSSGVPEGTFCCYLQGYLKEPFAAFKAARLVIPQKKNTGDAA